MNDLKHGMGEFIYDENTRYKGLWVEGKQHGDGMLITKDFARHGLWSEGKRVSWR